LGKRELRQMPITYMVIGMAAILLLFILYLQLSSIPANQLESDFKDRAVFDVQQVYQSPLTGGTALVTRDSTGNYLMQIYAQIPLLNRYQATEDYYFSDEGELNKFIVRTWSGYIAGTWEEDKLTETGVGESWGLGGNMILYLLLAEAIFILPILVKNDIVKTRKEKAANPVKNY
jgi:hypothetical protein